MTSALASLVLTATAAVPEVVAHRGYWRADGSAQNSIRGLVKADSIGCHAVELDVWLSADNVLYVNHNADVDGVIIETADSATLSKCRLGNGETVPTLCQFLDTARTLSPRIVLELKPHKDPVRENVAVPMIIEMIKEKGLVDRTSYITFSRNAFDDLVAKSGRPVMFLSAINPASLKEIGGSGADFNISVFRKNPEWIDELHELGLSVNIWTVDSEEDIQWCIDHGADYITTNEPELAAKLIERPCTPHD